MHTIWCPCDLPFHKQKKIPNETTLYKIKQMIIIIHSINNQGINTTQKNTEKKKQWVDLHLIIRLIQILDFIIWFLYIYEFQWICERIFDFWYLIHLSKIQKPIYHRFLFFFSASEIYLEQSIHFYLRYLSSNSKNSSK